MYSSAALGLLVCNIVFPILSTISVALRFRARTDSKGLKQLASDEYFILSALVITVALSIMAAWGATSGGFGIKQSDLSYNQNVVFLKLVFAGDIITLGALANVKISVIFFYRRIFSTPRFKMWSSIMMGITVAWFIAFFFCFLFPTWPIANNFIPADDGKHNIDFGAALLLSILTNIVLDIAILCLPLPQLRHLQMSRNRKYLIMGIFWLGAFCVVASIVRLYYVTQFTKIYGNQDEAYSDLTANLILWSTIEPNASIIAACLPTFGPLLSMQRVGNALSRLLQTLRRYSSGSRRGVELQSWEAEWRPSREERASPDKGNGGSGGKPEPENYKVL